MYVLAMQNAHEPMEEHLGGEFPVQGGRQELRDNLIKNKLVTTLAT